VAVNPANGAVRYQYRGRARMAASVNAAAPIVVKDQIFLSASYGTGAVLLQVANNAVTPVWSGDESMSNHYSTSVVAEGVSLERPGATDPRGRPCLSRAGGWALLRLQQPPVEWV